MKTIYLLAFLLCSHVAISQSCNWDTSLGYTYMAPINTMKQNINRGHGVTLDLYLIPKKFPRLAYGLDVNYTIYGRDKSRQRYTLDDNTEAPMDIIVSNTFTNFFVGARYYILETEGRKVSPYITLKGGYSWYRTALNIYDPDDTDHCEPVEQDILKNDGTFSVSGGAGLHWDLNTIFRKMPANMLFFNISGNLTLGGRVSYMNTDAPSHNHTDHESAVEAEFINTDTQVVHKHHVGYVYSSFVEMVDARASVVFRLARN